MGVGEPWVLREGRRAKSCDTLKEETNCIGNATMLEENAIYSEEVMEDEEEDGACINRSFGGGRGSEQKIEVGCTRSG